MSDFSGTLRVGIGSQPVPAQVAVAGGRLGVRVGDIEVGSWALSDLEIEIRQTGVGLTVGAESFTLDLTDTKTFIQALQVDGSSVSTQTRPIERRWPRRLLARRRPQINVRSVPALAGAVVLAGIVAAALLAPMVVGSVALLIGVILLSVGYLATTEPAIALRIPFGLAAAYLIVTGTGMVVIGTVMVLLG